MAIEKSMSGVIFTPVKMHIVTAIKSVERSINKNELKLTAQMYEAYGLVLFPNCVLQPLLFEMVFPMRKF